jgi:group I intron endonuclease
MAHNSIYKITNKINGKFYIGSSVDTRKRFWKHKCQLRKGNHPNAHLQASWLKYGEEAFDFVVIASFEDEAMLRQFEHSMLPDLVSRSDCYNKSAGVVAPKHTEDTKSLISEGVARAHSEKRGIYKGYRQSEEHKRAIRESLKGNQNAKGHVRTEEHRRNLSEANKGNQNWLGRKHTEESIAKMGTRTYAESPDGSVTEYISMNAMREALGMAGLASILRSVKSGYPMDAGDYAGWRFFTEKEDNRVPIPEEYKHLPRSRPQAKAEGAVEYFSGKPCKRGHISPRKTKGSCVACMKEDWKKQAVKTNHC